jgi:hypothetical protein
MEVDSAPTAHARTVCARKQRPGCNELSEASECMRADVDRLDDDRSPHS